MTIVEFLRAKVFRIEKPYALPAYPLPAGSSSNRQSWHQWYSTLKNERPVAYFFTEALPSFITKTTKAITRPFETAYYHCYNRFIIRSHMVETGLRPGDYHEADNKLLCAAFTILVDCVEIEIAHIHVGYSSGYKSEAKRWLPWRNSTAVLEWSNSLDCEPDDSDAFMKDMREIRDLYWWWKNRSNRVDPWEASGMLDIFSELEKKYKDQDGALWMMARCGWEPNEEERYDACSEIQDEMTATYRQEDNEMLSRLIAIRESLWT